MTPNEDNEKKAQRQPVTADTAAAPAIAEQSGAIEAAAGVIGAPPAPSAAQPAPAASIAPPPATTPAAARPTAPALAPKPASAAAAKPAVAPKPAAPPPPPFVAEPSLPVSMILPPDDAVKITPGVGDKLFAGELDEDFETVRARVVMVRRRSRMLESIARGLRRLWPATTRARHEEHAHAERHIAFDGFTNDLFEDKTERDRRYGTVYTVSEELNAYLVRLEMPRWLPNSALKRTWKLPDEMPDYEYSLSVADGVLSIRASVRGEACRRLSYVSSSFPSEFLTRIEFAKPVARFKHRMRDKVLEVVVFKREGDDLQRAA
jgi:hypothetical protein